MGTCSNHHSPVEGDHTLSVDDNYLEETHKFLNKGDEKCNISGFQVRLGGWVWLKERW